MIQSHFLEKFNVDPFLTIFGPFSSRAKMLENMDKRAAGDPTPPLAVRLGHSEGWKPPKVGGFRWGKSPRNCDSGRGGVPTEKKVVPEKVAEKHPG